MTLRKFVRNLRALFHRLNTSKVGGQTEPPAFRVNSVRMRVIAIKGPPKGRPVPTLLYRAQAYEADTHEPPTWECEHDHPSALEARDCGTEWLQRNSVPEADLK